MRTGQPSTAFGTALLLLLIASCACAPEPKPQSVVPSEGSETFPAAADFAGSPLRRSADAQTGGQATYDGTIAITMLDAGAVAAALPPGLRLAPRSGLAPAVRHPVVHLIGHQRDPHTLVGGQAIPVPLGRDYSELIVLIPFVVSDAGSRWHNYVVRMLLDDPAAVAIGNLHYAYAKQLALFGESGPQTAAWDGARLLWQGSVQPTGPWRPSADAEASVARYGELKSIFEMPLVGWDGGFVCSYWEWSFDAAQVMPAAAEQRFEHPLRGGMESWPLSTALHSAADGAVSISGLRWRLALPAPPCSF